MIGLKAKKLLNHRTNEVLYDTLHHKSASAGQCTRNVCESSLMFERKAATIPWSKADTLRLAEKFIDEYYLYNKKKSSPDHKSRWLEVTEEIARTGVYTHTQDELSFGAKHAWRNAPRCIGRSHWRNLKVFDARHVTTTEQMFEFICEHIEYATNGGNIRSAITLFPPRMEGKPDCRVWNTQLIGYAGYVNGDGTITGDASNLRFTQICLDLGWKSKRSPLDVLPLVLSIGDEGPDYFELDPSLVLEVDLTHPKYEWFAGFELKWFALPAVSKMLFDIGGVMFPAAPFNGWYMSTEIGRNLSDTNRYDMLEVVAKKMNEDTRSFSNLWKDKALVVINEAVLHSFKQQQVTIVDHHTASENFMQHFAKEVRVRGGCPSDWVWLTPPLSGSSCPVFHQEMLGYHLSPSYEYQKDAWEEYIKKQRAGSSAIGIRGLIKGICFSSLLFGEILSKRTKVTILYASETGKSEGYANKLASVFSHLFNAQVKCMEDCSINDIGREKLVLVVASTYGNGDPPENGQKFSKGLHALKADGSSSQNGLNQKTVQLNNLLTAGSVQPAFESSKKPVTKSKPFSDVRFAVFALGSTNYPNFCGFGIQMDETFEHLGGKRMMNIHTGDELDGQEKKFNTWAKEVLNVACEAFSLSDETAIKQATAALVAEESTQTLDVRFIESSTRPSLEKGLRKAHRKEVSSVPVVESRSLVVQTKNQLAVNDRKTQHVVLDTSGHANQMIYKPGDHLTVIPRNDPQHVEGIIEKLDGIDDPFKPVKLMTLKETTTADGSEAKWYRHDRLPTASLMDLFTSYLDIETPPSPDLLRFLSGYASVKAKKERLLSLATDASKYREWLQFHHPNLLEVLTQFSVVKPDAAHFVSHLPRLQPRLYSISSSPVAHPGQIHLTVAIVNYCTENGKGPEHFGVCSNFLARLKKGDTVQCFVKSASSFHLPADSRSPVILVGAGTGVAPFRGFWHQRLHERQNYRGDPAEKFGDMIQFFGCRTQDLNLYAEEKKTMRSGGALTKEYLALSREPNRPKKYVQDLLEEEGKRLVHQITEEKGHFYVCGGEQMGKSVTERVKEMMLKHTELNDGEVDRYLVTLKAEGRYHEDIYSSLRIPGEDLASTDGN